MKEYKHKPMMGSQLYRDSSPFPTSMQPKGFVYQLFIQQILESPEDFINAIEVLNMANQGDDVIIHLNSGGGSVDALDTLLFEMAKCRGHIHIRASGIIASAATFILLAGHSFEISPYAKLLFHSASFGSWGKAQDVYEEVGFTKTECERLVKDYYKDILTDEEIHDMLHNKREIWMTSEEFCKRYDAAQDKATESVQKAINDATEAAKIPEKVLAKMTKSDIINVFVHGTHDLDEDWNVVEIVED